MGDSVSKSRCVPLSFERLLSGIGIGCATARGERGTRVSIRACASAGVGLTVKRIAAVSGGQISLPLRGISLPSRLYFGKMMIPRA